VLGRRFYTPDLVQESVTGNIPASFQQFYCEFLKMAEFQWDHAGDPYASL